MTITERYLQQILPYLAGTDGGEVKPKMFSHGPGYEFPCPFCSLNQRKEYKKKNRCAALMPHQDSYGYTFKCCRMQSPDCSEFISFPRFLEKYNPDLFRRYHRERDQSGYTGKGHNLRKYQYPTDSGDVKKEFESKRDHSEGQK